MNVQALLQSVNLAELVARDGISLQGGQSEKYGPCPKCGGKDRFHVKRFGDKDYFFCRQCHEHRGDAIDYAKWAHELDFKSAINWLNLYANTTPQIPPTRPALPVPQLTENAPPSFAWQTAMRKFVLECQDNLAKNEAAMDYLHRRGLANQTILKYKLGLNTRDGQVVVSQDNPSLCARGIVIPCFVDDQLWYIQVRRPDGEINSAVGKKKYAKASGSRKALFNASVLENALCVLIVEGEFDAMLGQQFAPPGMAVVTLGSETNLPSPHWLKKLSTINRIIIGMDSDAVGNRANYRWKAVLPSAQMRHVPDGKDLTEFWQRGGDVAQWLKEISVT